MTEERVTPDPPRLQKPFAGLRQFFAPGGAPFTWLLIVVLLVVLLAAFGVITKGEFLQQLTDLGRARGLIMVTITFATICFAMILIVQAFVGEYGSNDQEAAERFRRAREVFTVLTGILGTIVGFYFGSAEKGAPELLVTGARIVDVGGGAVVAQVENGTPPYEYRIAFSDPKLPPIERKLGTPGWLFEPFEASPGVTAVITVTDGKRKEAVANAEGLPEAIAKAPPPTPKGGASTSAPQPSATVPPPSTTTPKP